MSPQSRESGLRPSKSQSMPTTKKSRKVKKVNKPATATKTPRLAPKTGRRRAIKAKYVPLFPKFKELPIEIRMMIWSYHTLEPVIITCAPTPMSEDNANYVRPVPSILKVCRESRNEFLHKEGVKKNHPTYRLCKNLLPLNSRNAIYISFEIDTLIFQYGTFFSSDLLKIQHIGFSNAACINRYTTRLSRGNWRTFDIADLLRPFENLKKITVFKVFNFTVHNLKQMLKERIDELVSEGEGWQRPELKEVAGRLPLHPKRKFDGSIQKNEFLL